MLWELRYTRDGFSIKAGELKGREPPEWYLEEPDIDEFNFWFFKAFWDLDTTRSFGSSIGPIPWTTIQAWADRHELDPVTTETLTEVIRCLDGAYLEWFGKKADG